MTEADRHQEVLTSLKTLFGPGQVIEVRTIGDDGIASGYYQDHLKAVQDILIRDKELRVSGIYVTLNEINPTLLGRRANRIKLRIGRSDATTADADIIRRRWLPIDIDPRRPSGISSSDTEHTDALVLADSIRQFLFENGWPSPVVGDSGNGAHLLYPIDLPNDEESRNLIRSVLEFLDKRFSDSRCKVDTANFNAARIWKIYGTTSRKGDPLPDRPHRRSRILSVPDHQVLLNAESMKALLSLATESTRIEQRTENAADSESSLDLGKWLDSHAITYTTKPYQGGTLFSLDSCPFSSAHTDGSFAIQFANGAVFAGCHHDSCGSGRQRWSELKAMFEEKPDIGTRLARLQSDRIRARQEAEGRNFPSDLKDRDCNHDLSEQHSVSNENSVVDDSECSDSIRERASEILHTQSPLDFLLKIFGTYHEGDQHVAECMIHSPASRKVVNSKGLHVSITGESGKGKSHAIETMQSLIPAKYCLDGRMSDKALFYMEDLEVGSVITLDDVSLSDQMQEILKGVTTSFQKPFLYRTVNKDRKPQVCTIPERCVWWIAKVEGSGDDQVFNRMLTCWIDDSEEQDLKVLDRTLAGAEQLPTSDVTISDDVRICRQIWQELSPVWVVIPYARSIRFQSAENRRNPDMLLDLIRTNAALCQQQREVRLIDGATCVVATKEDFHHAARLFTALNGKNGGQDTKLTKRETSLVNYLSSLGLAEVTIAQLQQTTGWSNSTIGKLIHGYCSYGKSYSGLLAKCPAISYLDRTIINGDDGCTTLRKTRVYLWDQMLYEAWIKGGSVWLADESLDEDSSGTPPDDTTPLDLQTSPSQDSSLDTQIIPSSSTKDTESQDIPVMKTGVSLASINPQDYTRLEGFPDKRHCSVCGRKPTQYQERTTSVRIEDPSKSSRMLCASCYSRAVSRASAAIIPLPGIIDTGQMVQRSVSIGICHLCGIQSASWSDSASRTNLCDECYRRQSDTKAIHHSKEHGPP